MYENSSSITHKLDSVMVCGPFPTKKVRVAAGNLKAFSVLGEKKKNTITQDSAGITGNGLMTGLAFKKLAVVGDYIVECIVAATNGGRFKVIAPNGDRLDDAVVGVAYANDYLDFSIADGTTDFIVGDKFTLTIAAPASEEYLLSAAAPVDGSEIPDVILAEDADASSAPVEALAYTGGEFAEGGLTFGTGHTRATTFDTLRDKGITIQKSYT